jgi:ankyrin repeat protein
VRARGAPEERPGRGTARAAGTLRPSSPIAPIRSRAAPTAPCPSADAFVLGTLFHYLVRTDENTVAFKVLLKAVEEFGLERRLPATLMARITTHFRFQHSKQSSATARIFAQMPRTLQMEVASEQYAREMQATWVFFNCTPQFLNSLVLHVRERFLTPRELLFKRGDGALELLWCVSGNLLVKKADVLIATIRSDIGPGQVVGDIAFFCGIPQPYTVQASAQSEVTLVVLHSSGYDEIVASYPEQLDTITSTVLRKFGLDKNGNDVSNGAVLADGARDKEEQEELESLRESIRQVIIERNEERLAQMATAVLAGDLETIRSLCHTGFDINLGNYDQQSALHLAAAAGHSAVAELLIESSADVNARDRWNDEPINLAIDLRHGTVAQVLRRNGATLRLDNPAARIHEAVSQTDINFLQMLLEAGVDVNSVDYDGRTGLHFATTEGNTRMAEYLIGALADVHAMDRWGRTALDDAIDAEEMLLTQLMLRSSAQPNKKMLVSKLRIAAASADTRKVQFLIDIGVSIVEYARAAPHYDGRSALHYATLSGSISTVYQLVNVLMDVNALDFWGRSPLVDALETGPELAALLLRSGAELPIEFAADDALKRKLAAANEVKMVPVMREIGRRNGARRELQLLMNSLARDMEITCKTMCNELEQLLRTRRLLFRTLSRHASVWISAYADDSFDASDSGTDEDESSGDDVGEHAHGGAQSQHVAAGVRMLLRAVLQLPKVFAGLMALRDLFKTHLQPSALVQLSETKRRLLEEQTLRTLLAKELHLPLEQADLVLSDAYVELAKLIAPQPGTQRAMAAGLGRPHPNSRAHRPWSGELGGDEVPRVIGHAAPHPPHPPRLLVPPGVKSFVDANTMQAVHQLAKLVQSTDESATPWTNRDSVRLHGSVSMDNAGVTRSRVGNSALAASGGVARGRFGSSSSSQGGRVTGPYGRRVSRTNSLLYRSAAAEPETEPLYLSDVGFTVLLMSPRLIEILGARGTAAADVARTSLDAVRDGEEPVHSRVPRSSQPSRPSPWDDAKPPTISAELVRDGVDFADSPTPPERELNVARLGSSPSAAPRTRKPSKQGLPGGVFSRSPKSSARSDPNDSRAPPAPARQSVARQVEEAAAVLGPLWHVFDLDKGSGRMQLQTVQSMRSAALGEVGGKEILSLYTHLSQAARVFSIKPPAAAAPPPGPSANPHSERVKSVLSANDDGALLEAIRSVASATDSRRSSAGHGQHDTPGKLAAGLLELRAAADAPAADPADAEPLAPSDELTKSLKHESDSIPRRRPARSLKREHFFLGVASWVKATVGDPEHEGEEGDLSFGAREKGDGSDDDDGAAVSRDSRPMMGGLGLNLLALKSIHLSGEQAAERAAAEAAELGTAIEQFWLVAPAPKRSYLPVGSDVALQQLEAALALPQATMSIVQNLEQRVASTRIAADDPIDPEDLLRVLTNCIVVPPGLSAKHVSSYCQLVFKLDLNTNHAHERRTGGESDNGAEDSAPTWGKLINAMIASAADQLRDEDELTGDKHVLAAAADGPTARDGRSALDHLHKPWFIVSIKSKLHSHLHLLFVLVAAFDCLIIPVQLAYVRIVERVGWVTPFNLTFDALYWVFVFVRFNTSYVNASSVEIVEPKACRSMYLAGNFARDVFAIMPLNLAVLATGASPLVLFLFRLPRFLNARYVVRSYLAWSRRLADDDLFNGMASKLGVLLITIHFLACVLAALDAAPPEGQPTWLTYYANKRAAVHGFALEHPETPNASVANNCAPPRHAPSPAAAWWLYQRSEACARRWQRRRSGRNDCSRARPQQRHASRPARALPTLPTLLARRPRPRAFHVRRFGLALLDDAANHHDGSRPDADEHGRVWLLHSCAHPQPHGQFARDCGGAQSRALVPAARSCGPGRGSHPIIAMRLSHPTAPARPRVCRSTRGSSASSRRS